MEKMILIKYGELSTKKTNRHKFIKKLAKNIEDKISNHEYEIKYTNGRMYIYTDKIEEISKVLKTIFGISSFVVSYEIESEINEITDSSLLYLKMFDFKTFKIETRRRDKNFPMDTKEINPLVGAHILKNIPNISVDVRNPDITLNIEIREDKTYLYSDEIKGAGGYPSKIQSRGLLMLSGGIDSPVAGYLALKRGIELECIYFESPPHTSVMAKNKVMELTRLLSYYTDKIKLHIIPFTKMQEEIYKNVPLDYNITIMRRMMYRISEKVAYINKTVALINGESIGQVASQTLTSMYAINNVTSMPVIRPVSTYDKEEIIKISKEINTYETSILPFIDCCTLFVPKHPVINPKIEKCEHYEKSFDYEGLIDEIMKNYDTKIIKYNDTNYDESLL